MENKVKKTTPLSDEEKDAWCEWRKWCSIWRVRQPAPSSAEIEAGKTDDIPPEVRQKYFLYLSRKIDKAIRKKIEVFGVPYYTSDKFDGAELNLLNETISAFDDYMNGSKKRKKDGFTGVSYKDYIFHLIASGENFSRIINGKIFGKKAGYIRSIVVKYVEDNFSLEHGPKGGVSYWDAEDGKYHQGIRLLPSMNQTIDLENEHSLFDVLADKHTMPFLEEKYDFSPLLKNLTQDEKLIIVAKMYGVPMSNPGLLKALECKKTKTCDLHNKLFPPVNARSCPDSLYAKIETAGFGENLAPGQICEGLEKEQISEGLEKEQIIFITELIKSIIFDLAAEKRFYSFLYNLDKNIFK
ncbi:MAG: hypothetical protein IJZ19_01415 [Lentisphaeria bacterium]|nr:hypothetical protein [Lentisphaeria bacterium]